jgi:cbb3-type cytochrome oxidase subunit 3
MKHRVPVLVPFLVFVSILFIGILIFTYVETKKANPQMIQAGPS